MASTGDDLPLVDQVHIASERRGAPGVARHANAGVGQGTRAHANFHARGETGLTAVDRGHTQLGHPLAPGAVGQDHGLGHDEIQGRTPLAHAQRHRFRALGAVVAHAFQSEGVVGPVEGFRFTSHLLAVRFEGLRKPVQKGQFGVGQGLQRAGGVITRDTGVRRIRLQPRFGDHGVEAVVAQIGHDVHTLQARLARENVEAGLVEFHIQRESRAVLALLQGVGLHHLIRQHGDFVARHVHRGQP